MSRPTQTLDRLIRSVGLLLLAGMFLVALPVSAQAIKVTSAIPDNTEQGVTGLVVTIGGENFGSGAKVAFYVTGTTNPGGIAVKGVKFKDSKTLEATIDVAPDAQTTLKFDIQVRCNGRTGKGTELFKVIEKVTGSDRTPPGTVMDLRASDVGFNTASFSWTAPADDGYIVASGPAATYDVRVRKGWSVDTPDCGPFGLLWPSERNSDPCYVEGAGGGTASVPGATESASVCCLAPNTTYWALVRTQDDAPPTGNWSDLNADVAYQVSFVTGPFPPPPFTTPWSAGIVDICQASDGCSWIIHPRFDFDAAGNPAMVYEKNGVLTLATWTGGGWRYETVPGLGGDFDIAFDASGVASITSVDVRSALVFQRRGATPSDPWSVETVVTGGFPSFSNRHVLRFNPVDSVPTIAYVFEKANRRVLRLAERRNGSWMSQDIASSIYRVEGLAFDRNGNPGVAFLQETNGVNKVCFARRVAGTWSIEYPDPGPGDPWTSAYDAKTAFDPGRGDFTVTSKFKNGTGFHYRVRVCDRTSGAWACATLDEGELAQGPSIAYSPDGTAYVSYIILPTHYVAVRRPGATAWTREYVDWNGYVGSTDLRVGPDGQPGVAYSGANGELGVGDYQPACFARRTPSTP